MSAIAESVTGSNKELVTNYVARVWNERDVGALPHFVAAGLVQHNPHLADGRDALSEFLTGCCTQTPHGRFEDRRVLSDGDLVVTHALFRSTPDDNGTAVVDIYRISNGLIAEHWDVKESVPAGAAMLY